MKKMLFAIALLAMGCGAPAFAQAETEELKKQIEALGEKVKALEDQKAAASAPSPVQKVLSRTTFGGYGELDFISKRDNGGPEGGKTIYDPHRFVLYVNSDLADWISLSTELEWEHGGFSPGATKTEVAVEQAFVEFKLNPAFNVRTGIMLVPVGAVNLYHEPTNFNSTERPELNRFLIPTTWREMGAGFVGRLGERADYQLLVLNGLDGSKFTAKDGIREGRQTLDKDNNREKALSGRLELRPATNLYTNFSFYTGDSAKKGSKSAYTTIGAVDAKYSISILDISGEYVHIYQDSPKNLGVAEVGHNMAGYWVEGALHVMPKALKRGKLAESDLVVFGRYSEFDTQKGKILDETKASGLYNREYTTVGLSFKPVPTVAVKADYQFYDDGGRKPAEKPLDSDKFQITVGFVF